MIPFLSTPSARRATRPAGPDPPALRYFYPRPPRGGRRKTIRLDTLLDQISIHALREEGDPHDLAGLREVGVFLSTPSARRATVIIHVHVGQKVISIHALREEGDEGL